MSGYCFIVLGYLVYDYYYVNEYGFLQCDECELFEWLVLEINQVGLSWEMILKKCDGFCVVYDGFDVDCVVVYVEQDIECLLLDVGIICNWLKVLVVIYNVQVIQQLWVSYGSFVVWLDVYYLCSKVDWVKLFKKMFCFIGGEIIGEFLMSLGYLLGVYVEDCLVYVWLLMLLLLWLQVVVC